MNFLFFFLLVNFSGAINVLHSSSDRLVFEIKTKINLSNNGKYVKIIADGEDIYLDEAGAPEIPIRKVFFAVPPDARVDISVTPLKVNRVKLKRKVIPVPEYKDEGLTPYFFENPRYYNKKQFYPDRVSGVLKRGIVRNIEYCELPLYPISYNPAAGLLEIKENIRVEVKFIGGKEGLTIQNDPFEPVYRSLLMNYEEARNWGIARNSVKTDEDPFDRAVLWFKVYVYEEGIYKVTYNDLVEAGLPSLPILNTAIVLYSLGGDTLSGLIDSAYAEFKPASFKLIDGGDGFFNDDDYLLFYGIPMKTYRRDTSSYYFFEHPYCDTNVYWIGVGTMEPGSMITTVDARPLPQAPLKETGISILRHENNLINLGEKGIRWEGELIERGRNQPYKDSTFTFTLSNLAGNNGTIRISGVTEMDLDRTIIIYFNGAQIGEVFLSGVASFDETYEVNNLQNGTNTLTLRVTSNDNTVSEVDRLYLDFFEVVYPAYLTSNSDGGRLYTGDAQGVYRVKFSGTAPQMIWRINDPLHPVELTNWDENSLEFSDTLSPFSIYYLATDLKRPVRVELKSPTNLRMIRDIDYIAIAPKEFKGVLEQYRDWLEENLYLYSEAESAFVKTGGTVAIVSLEDIYENFGYGIKDPVAIRNFVKYVYDHSVNPPHYLTLVGDGNYDYKNFTSAGGNLVPPYEPWPIIDKNRDRKGAWDDFYGDMDGDGYTDFYQGRLTVRNSAELSSYIEKVKTYMSGRTFGSWRNRVVLVADDEYGGPNSRHELPWHVKPSDSLYRHHIPERVEVRTLYLTDIMPITLRNYFGRRAFIEIFNRGSLVLNIFSHGNPESLTHEKIFHLPLDREFIDCGRKNPFVIIASCKTGAFDRILPPKVIAEDWAIREGGSIATYSTTTLSSAGPNSIFVRAIFDGLRAYDRIPLGCLTLFGKHLSSGNKYYVLIGEPAVVIGYPAEAGTLSVEPDTMRWLDRIYVTGSGAISDELFLRVYGVRKIKHYVSQEGDSIDYLLPQRLLFNGLVSSNSGDIEASFLVPFPVDTGNGAKITIIDPSSSFGRVLLKYPLTIQGTDLIPTDTAGPSINVYLNGREIVDTPTVPTKIYLEAEISDPLGIKVGRTGLVGGYSIYAVIDGSDTVDLSEIFEYKLNTDTVGVAFFKVNFKGGGLKRIEIFAQDNRGNFSTWRGFFNVVSEELLRLSEVYIYPNPLKRFENIHITFFVNKDVTVWASVYTTSGLLIWRSSKKLAHAGYNEIIWNGRDFDGDELANGLYFVKIEAQSEGGESKKLVKRLIISR